MSHESSPHHSPEQARSIPEYLDERMELIGQLDTQFEEWGMIAESHHPRFTRSPLADMIVKDCGVIEDIEAELDQRNLPEQSLSERSIAKDRLERLQPIARQAHNPTLDSIKIKHSEYAEIFEHLEAYVEDTSTNHTLLEAFKYLRRLFTIREELALRNGRTEYDSKEMTAIIKKILKDECRINQTSE